MAAFDYSPQFGQGLAPNAESGTKTLKFTNPNNQLFTFTVRVIASTLCGNGGTTASGGTASTSGGTTSGGTTSSGTGTTSTGGSILTTTKLLKFTVNPLTGTVSLAK